MKNDDNRKNYRRQKLENRKKSNKLSFDEDAFYQRKLNKEFKRKRKTMLEEDNDLSDWNSDEL